MLQLLVKLIRGLKETLLSLVDIFLNIFFFKFQKHHLKVMYHFNPIQDGGGPGEEKATYQFSLRTYWQSQFIELELRPSLKKSSFSGQILIKLRL